MSSLCLKSKGVAVTLFSLMNNNNQGAISWITRTLAFLGACCVVTVCILSYRGIQIPPELNTLTGGLVGSLASMLVKTTPTESPKHPGPDGEPPGGDNPPPIPVTVENPASDPVQTQVNPPKKES